MTAGFLNTQGDQLQMNPTTNRVSESSDRRLATSERLCLTFLFGAFAAIHTPAMHAQTFQAPSTLFAQSVKTEVTTEESPSQTQELPASPNPYLSLLPADATPDYDYWRAKMRLDSRERARRQSASRSRGIPNFPENEGGGGNDWLASANPIVGFSTQGTATVTLSGSSDGPASPTLPNPTTSEENGSILHATPVLFTVDPGGNQSFTVTSEIGDGAHGSSGSFTGDFDFYEVALLAGELLTVDIHSPQLDSIVGVFDSTGLLLGANDDELGEMFHNSLLSFTAPANGNYYVAIGGWLSLLGDWLTLQFPFDPFDPSSGLVIGDEGPYDATFSINDADLFSVFLNAGDVLGLASDVILDLSILDPSGSESMGSLFTGLTGIAPPESPLPAGTSEVSTVAEASGNHYVRIRNPPSLTSAGTAYSITAQLFRPPTESAPSEQVLFIDFDGATIDSVDLFGGGNDPATLSPLADFLAAWGLNPADEDAVIDAILATVDENLTDLVATNPGVAFKLRNSRDHTDTFGTEDRVSRVIVGGTIEELGLATIGVAESIDTGNFGLEETAVVLLDFLSAPAEDPNSLNQFPIAAGSTIIDLIGVGVGNITTHEAGHFIGNWHTDQFNAIASIQDQGGNVALYAGVGPNGTFGDGDDIDVDFVHDVFNPDEGFTGIESQNARSAFGLTHALFTDGFESGDTSAWSSGN